MGIHNEAGHIRLAPIPTLHDLIASMLGLIMSTKDKERAFLPFLNDGEDEVILMVNNLGGLSQLELGGIAGETVKALRDKVHIRRVLSGSFMVSKSSSCVLHAEAECLLEDESEYARILVDSPPPSSGRRVGCADSDRDTKPHR